MTAEKFISNPEVLSIDELTNAGTVFLITTCVLFIVHCFIDAVGPTVSDMDVAGAIQQMITLSIPTMTLEQAVAIQRAILTNSLQLIFNSDSMEILRQNLNMVHIIIYHGLKQYIFIATLTEHFEFAIRSAVQINFTTSIEELANYATQLENTINYLKANMDLFHIKVTIFCIGGGEGVLNFFTTAHPFFPFSNILASNSWSLFVHVYCLPDIFLYLSNVGSANLNHISGFIALLIDKGYHLFDMVMAIPSDELAEDTWGDIKAITQLIRYLETIHRIYSPIDAADTNFTNMMEED